MAAPAAGSAAPSGATGTATAVKLLRPDAQGIMATVFRKFGGPVETAFLDFAGFTALLADCGIDATTAAAVLSSGVFEVRDAGAIYTSQRERSAPYSYHPHRPHFVAPSHAALVPCGGCIASLVCRRCLKAVCIAHDSFFPRLSDAAVGHFRGHREAGCRGGWRFAADRH